MLAVPPTGKGKKDLKMPVKNSIHILCFVPYIHHSLTRELRKIHFVVEPEVLTNLGKRNNTVVRCIIVATFILFTPSMAAVSNTNQSSEKIVEAPVIVWDSMGYSATAYKSGELNYILDGNVPNRFPLNPEVRDFL